MHPGRNHKGHDWHAGRHYGLHSRISGYNKTNNHHSLSPSYYNLLTNSIYESYLLNPNNFLNSRNILVQRSSFGSTNYSLVFYSVFLRNIFEFLLTVCYKHI
ncbi:hypothetical protein EDEG_03186 [Edhazardia aedis USNM 41457]|uniref:Uncharacterized protein n=1 Tax=Edhazardia aedis (strain USNM 41457) TaxID=1003232 RepID=J9DLX1_EDHAE|nr:hypothetical protein EDEG_03186 [Edhazardia aedis USNM 41457]|eukprot:EJW02382.1 hypothetical protein EDEG_03186 [Edhazardia aedis USNM 41457]